MFDYSRVSESRADHFSYNFILDGLQFVRDCGSLSLRQEAQRVQEDHHPMYIYHYVGIIGSLASLSAFEAVYFTVTSQLYIIILIGIVGGFFIFPLQPLLVAYASDVAFPVGQGSITGFLFAFSQTFGFISGLVFISWIDKTNIWKIYATMGFHILFFCISLFFNLKTREILNRTRFEQKKLEDDQYNRLEDEYIYELR